MTDQTKKNLDDGKRLQRDEWMTSLDGDVASLISPKSLKSKDQTSDQQFKKPAQREYTMGLYVPGRPEVKTSKTLSTEASLDWSKIKVQRMLELVKRNEATLEDAVNDRFGSLAEFDSLFANVRHLLEPSLVSVYYNHSKGKETDIGSKPGAESKIDINKLIAQKLRAELAGDDHLAAKIQERIDEHHRESKNNLSGSSHKRPLSKGSKDPTIAEMVRHERLTSNRRDMDSEYIESLCKKHSKDNDDEDEDFKSSIGPQSSSKVSSSFMDKIIQKCWFCPDSASFDAKLVLATGYYVQLLLPHEASLDPLQCQIVPRSHTASWRCCDEMEWTELRNFQKSLLQMAHNSQGG